MHSKISKGGDNIAWILYGYDMDLSFAGVRARHMWNKRIWFVFNNIWWKWYSQWFCRAMSCIDSGAFWMLFTMSIAAVCYFRMKSFAIEFQQHSCYEHWTITSSQCSQAIVRINTCKKLELPMSHPFGWSQRNRQWMSVTRVRRVSGCTFCSVAKWQNTISVCCSLTYYFENYNQMWRDKNS